MPHQRDFFQLVYACGTKAFPPAYTDPTRAGERCHVQEPKKDQERDRKETDNIQRYTR